MSNMQSVWQFLGSCVGKFLTTFASNWYLSIFLYLILLAIIIDILVTVRGSK